MILAVGEHPIDLCGHTLGRRYPLRHVRRLLPQTCLVFEGTHVRIFLHRRWDTTPARFDESTRRYHVELTDPERAAAPAPLRELGPGKKMLTLLTATKDVDISEAAAQAELVLS